VGHILYGRNPILMCNPRKKRKSSNRNQSFLSYHRQFSEEISHA
jgi:hypothetical protein